AEVSAAAMPRGKTGSDRNRIHPTTRSSQGIRIFINRELADLEAALIAAMERLQAGGRMVVIRFHSLEDRDVNEFIAARAKAPPTDRRRPEPEAFVPTLRAIGGARKAGERELAGNPRARSAVLRVAERLAGVAA